MSYLPELGVGVALLAGLLIRGRMMGRRFFGTARVGVRRFALAFLPVWLLGVANGLAHRTRRPAFSIRADGLSARIAFAGPAPVALIVTALSVTGREAAGGINH